MKCPQCQFENPADSSFCSKCATPLLPSDDIPTVSHTKTPQTPGEEMTRGNTFASRYEVIEELGRGGMGRVYRVFDRKIGEEVALKLLKPEIASDKRTIERFRNELRFARKIAHRNVCRMYNLSEEYEAHYITMEYVPGEDLKSMIKMTRQLSAGQLLFITKQLCEGLAEAHRLGVVHRDLKPKNIIIDKEGNARIMDFGIARSTKDKGITGVGVMIGTPEYMPPEQVEGKEADQRSDIYSLGVIMYEMATGRLPFKGDSSLSIALKHKTEEPPDPRNFNPQMPEALRQVILRCLEKDKEKRYQDTKELRDELNEIEEGISTAETLIPEGKTAVSKEVKVKFRKRLMMIAALLVVVVMTGIAIPYFINKKAVLIPGEKMIVVLPFQNLGSSEDEYFADGITGEITNRLSALSGLSVISSTSAFKYKNTNKTIKQIGEELGVDYVLEGAVRWDRSGVGNGRVRVTPQLIRVSDDIHLWSDRYDRVIYDIFAVQSEIAEEVARQLDLRVLEPERKAMIAKPTDNIKAYDYYLKGLDIEAKGWRHSNAQEFEEAIKMFEKATELDPNFALAYANISMVHSRMYFFGIGRTEECRAKARAAVDRALALQPDLPLALIALSTYYYRCFLDYDRAEEIFESLQTSRPNISPSLLGYIQRRQGKWEQALATLERAFKLNPRYSQLAYEIGLCYLALRKYREAEEWFDRTLSINPDHLSAQLGKVGISVLSRGDTRRARALLQTVRQHQLKDYMWFTLGMLERNYQEVLDRLSSLSYDSFEEQQFYFQKNLAYASVYHAKGDLSLMKTHAESARVVLEKILRENPTDPRFHAALGLTYAYLGRNDEAVQEGNRAVTLYPPSKDAALGPAYVLNLAKIYAVMGQYDKAIERLDYLLSTPNCEYLWQLVSVPRLQLEPQWDAMRNHPKFARLLQKYTEVGLPE